MEEVKHWIDHLHTIKINRLRGAAKAAQTRKRMKLNDGKQKESTYYCATCKTPYQDYTDQVEQWIGCDTCDSWFHFTCLGIDTPPESFQCDECYVLLKT